MSATNAINNALIVTAHPVENSLSHSLQPVLPENYASKVRRLKLPICMLKGLIRR